MAPPMPAPLAPFGLGLSAPEPAAASLIGPGAGWHFTAQEQPQQQTDASSPQQPQQLSPLEPPPQQPPALPSPPQSPPRMRRQSIQQPQLQQQTSGVGSPSRPWQQSSGGISSPKRWPQSSGSGSPSKLQPQTWLQPQQHTSGVGSTGTSPMQPPAPPLPLLQALCVCSPRVAMDIELAAQQRASPQVLCWRGSSPPKLLPPPPPPLLPSAGQVQPPAGSPVDLGMGPFRFQAEAPIALGPPTAAHQRPVPPQPPHQDVSASSTSRHPCGTGALLGSCSPRHGWSPPRELAGSGSSVTIAPADGTSSSPPQGIEGLGTAAAQQPQVVSAVRVPLGHKVGQPIAIRTAVGLVLVPLPPGAGPGDEVPFDVELVLPDWDEGRRSAGSPVDIDTDVDGARSKHQRGSRSGGSPTDIDTDLDAAVCVEARSADPSPPISPPIANEAPAGGLTGSNRLLAWSGSGADGSRGGGPLAGSGPSAGGPSEDIQEEYGYPESLGCLSPPRRIVQHRRDSRGTHVPIASAARHGKRQRARSRDCTSLDDRDLYEELRRRRAAITRMPSFEKRVPPGGRSGVGHAGSVRQQRRESRESAVVHARHLVDDSSVPARHKRRSRASPSPAKSFGFPDGSEASVPSRSRSPSSSGSGVPASPSTTMSPVKQRPWARSHDRRALTGAGGQPPPVGNAGPLPPMTYLATMPSFVYSSSEPVYTTPAQKQGPPPKPQWHRSEDVIPPGTRWRLGESSFGRSRSSGGGESNSSSSSSWKPQKYERQQPRQQQASQPSGLEASVGSRWVGFSQRLLLRSFRRSMLRIFRETDCCRVHPQRVATGLQEQPTTWESTAAISSEACFEASELPISLRQRTAYDKPMDSNGEHAPAAKEPAPRNRWQRTLGGATSEAQHCGHDSGGSSRCRSQSPTCGAAETLPDARTAAHGEGDAPSSGPPRMPSAGMLVVRSSTPTFPSRSGTPRSVGSSATPRSARIACLGGKVLAASSSHGRPPALRGPVALQGTSADTSHEQVVADEAKAAASSLLNDAASDTTPELTARLYRRFGLEECISFENFVHRHEAHVHKHQKSMPPVGSSASSGGA
eukprot:gnl/TRDRNA2_/TRDRNA2_80245_c0_seq1.p1 gnl/TRDRNA2_/TRDRNA2_80245_c0~~gnl/TRDRNA2_/TRDRNA2_80245_c0_seq1.p1  ORF type:complete len:1236 (+),score=212.93 gnl/TRDRNA2_/TRDRNA2_80245_c0_seq1:458-3709(+)